jgi:hypothetical protein
MLTNYDLIDAGIKYDIPIVGIYNKNKLPNTHDIREGGYIVNLENDVDEFGKSLNGSHWVGFYVEKDKRGKLDVVYYDSFGAGPPIAVQNFLRPLSPYAYNNDVIQNINSSVCGYYVLHFIWFMSRNKKLGNLDKRFKIFLNLFKKDPEKNLSFLKRYMKEIK